MNAIDPLSEITVPADAAVYFPPENGLYEVKPGLRPLSTDMGNGAQDGQTFQFDGAFPQYRRNKIAARAERLDKYYRTRDFGPEVSAPICDFIARKLVEEHPDRFPLEESADGLLLDCRPSGEQLRFAPSMQTVEGGSASPPYADPFDALAGQIQEDLAVMRRVDGRDWVCAIHLCTPHVWTPEQKIGLDYVTMHQAVPAMDRFRRPGMVNVMVNTGPNVRFVWALITDTRLNHHHEPPPGVDPVAWAEKPFDPRNPRLFLRVDREVIWGFPEQDAALLALHIHFRDCAEIRRDQKLRDALCSAILSMTPQQLEYKGLKETRDDILTWLKGD